MYDCQASVCLESLLTLDVFLGVDARAAGEVLVRTRPVVSACFSAHACLASLSEKHGWDLLRIEHVQKSGSLGPRDQADGCSSLE